MEQAVSRRGINHIWHFTRLDNLHSILSDGIVPRLQLERRNSPPLFNDLYRLDGQRGASCFSIGHPNYKMFYRLRCENPGSKWVVIGCRASVLWEKDCAFCHENAASNAVTCIPVENRKGPAAFQRLFAEIEGKPSRESLALPDNCPTHPQAEVLVFNVVEPSYIVGAICQDHPTAQDLTARYPDFQMIYHRAHFSARKDYEHWR